MYYRTRLRIINYGFFVFQGNTNSAYLLEVMNLCSTASLISSLSIGSTFSKEAIKSFATSDILIS